MLNILTIVYNGEPYIERHLPIFEKLKTPWTWFIAEGPANNGGSTSWCTPQQEGSSTDGTLQYLNSIYRHPNVTVICSELWRSKDAMVSWALSQMTKHGILFQCDSDEIWLAGQLEKIVELFESDPSLGAIKFPCRYFVGENLVCVGENCWSNKADEYMRAWRYVPGLRVVSHEPPKFDKQLGRTMERDEARAHDLTFDHMAYVLEKQVAYKEKFYGYNGAVEGWRRLQAHTQFPVPLRQFFSWLPDDRTLVKRFREEGDAACATGESLHLSASNAAPTVQPTGAAVFQTEELSGGVESRHAESSMGGGRESRLRIITDPSRGWVDNDLGSGSSAPPAQIFCHSGDLGDIISALPAIRTLGGGDLIITDGAHGQRESMKGARFDAIKPLLEAQPYIKSVRWEDNPTGVTHDFRGFRKLKAQMHGASLAQWQWQYIGLEGKANLEPWLTVPPSSLRVHNVTVIARSLRYNNPVFPWKDIVQGISGLFVGLREEHDAFCRAVAEITYWPTKDLLELAQLIAVARLTICNQSAPFWIAAGLGVPTVQETWAKDQNSIVNRPNALYSRTEYETSHLLEKLENTKL